jgi:hypothetical protein
VWNSVPNEALPPASALAPGTLRILVIGDSVSKFLGNSMRFRQATANAFVAQRGVGNCSIHPADDGSSCASDWAKDVAELRPDVTFVFLGGGFLGPRTCEAAWRRSYRERLLSLLVPLAADAGRIVLALPPYPGARWREGHTLASARCFDADLAKIAAEQGWGTVDVMAHMCPTTDCIEESDGWPVRRDGLHPDGPGSFALADWVLGELVRVAGSSASHDR